MILKNNGIIKVLAKRANTLTLLFLSILLIMTAASCKKEQNEKWEQRDDIKIGAYFFDGWSGKNRHANDPNEPWAENAPSHLTRRMIEEFSHREPLWGWRSDSQDIVEMQINLAADHGI